MQVDDPFAASSARWSLVSGQPSRLTSETTLENIHTHISVPCVRKPFLATTGSKITSLDMHPIPRDSRALHGCFQVHTRECLHSYQCHLPPFLCNKRLKNATSHGTCLIHLKSRILHERCQTRLLFSLHGRARYSGHYASRLSQRSTSCEIGPASLPVIYVFLLLAL